MKILIVGNATSVKPYNTDDYDVVVRINCGISEGDCDYWFNGDVDLRRQRESLGNRLYGTQIRTYTDKRFKDFHLKLPRTIMLGTSGVGLYELGLDGAKPTTGYIAVRYMRELYPHAEVYLVGFDWYETLNRQTGKPQLSVNHNLELEKAILGVLPNITIL